MRLFRYTTRPARPRAIRFIAALLALLGLTPPARALSPMEVAAMEEMRNLETALDFCFLDTGYLVALEALNDIDFATFPVYDYIAEGNGTRVIRIETGAFNPNPVNLLPTWLGPYINFQSGQTQLGVVPYDQGSPVDPWGAPYLFYSPLGLLRGDTATVTLDFHADVFDRYTIVSMGADGVPSADDLIRPIGPGIAGVGSLAVSSISGPGVRWITSGGVTRFYAKSAASLVVKGYHFGAAQGASKALFNGMELPVARVWTDTRIELDLPETVSGTGDFMIMVGAASSPPHTLIVAPNAAEHWEKYE